MNISKKVIAVAIASAFALAGCSQSGSNSQSSSQDGSKLSVKASFYPLQYLVEEIGGDHVSVDSLTPPGTDAHSLELSPKTVAELSQADAVVYLKGFQSAVDEAVKEAGPANVLDVTEAAQIVETSEDGHDDHEADEHAHEDHESHDHEGEDDNHEHLDDEHDHGDEEHHHHHDIDGDPHFWLDANRMATVATQVGDLLAQADSDNADDYRKRAETVSQQMTDLANDMESGLEQCEKNTFIVSHQAFGYLAHNTGLHQVGVSGLDPEVTPSPERLKAIGEVVKDTGTQVIFTEVNVSPKVMEVLAEDLGIETSVLDPIETLNDPEENYVSLMKTNLENLRKGLNCQ
ncbi:MAG: metal ABC transporter substrate-binding protein [Actinomycetaceae bacterium]|nr:metal ABC transporter substrate-binding protein [Actinomycetaceae bacterium]